MPNLQGFATDISVNRGGTVFFKVKTDASSYRFDIYRMGYYGGLGARKIETVTPTATLPQNQPNCLTEAATGLIDCGNWSVSGSWAVPANAASGIYFAKLVRTDTGGASHIVFVVRDDSSTSDIVFQTSDTTWQAYNNYGGNSLYTGSPAGTCVQGELQPAVQHARRRQRAGLAVQRRVPDGAVARGERLQRQLHRRRGYRSIRRSLSSTTGHSSPSATTSTGPARSGPTSRPRGTPA